MTTISYPCPHEQSVDGEREREVGHLSLPEVRRLPEVVTRAQQGGLGVEARRQAGWVESDVEARRAIVEPNRGAVRLLAHRRTH